MAAGSPRGPLVDQGPHEESGGGAGDREVPGVDHPSPLSLVTHLKKELLGVDAAAGARAEHESSRRGTRTPAAGDDDPLVIVSMSCRFPGAANSPEQLWELIAEGRDAVSEFPADRGWDLDRALRPGAEPPWHFVCAGGRLRRQCGGVRRGRCSGFRRGEALAMDPQQRLLLETSLGGLRACRASPSVTCGESRDRRLRRRRYVLLRHRHGARRGRRAGAEGTEGFLLTGTATAVLSGRISYTFGLEGPAVTVDTACSSSLVALHMAAQAVPTVDCSLALVGGVTVMATPAAFVEFCRQRGLPPTAGAKPSPATPTAPAGAKVSACSLSSGCRTPGATVTRSWLWFAVRPSTRTELEWPRRAERPLPAEGDPAGPRSCGAWAG